MNSIGGHIVFVGNIPSLTSKSIRSGRNILIICMAYIFITTLVAIYLTSGIVGEAHDMPPLFNSWQFGLCLAIVCHYHTLFIFISMYSNYREVYLQECMYML